MESSTCCTGGCISNSVCKLLSNMQLLLQFSDHYCEIGWGYFLLPCVVLFMYSLIFLKCPVIALMYIYIRLANFTTKP